MKNQILSCEWGTSLFRLRLITLPERQLAGEITNLDGVASTFTPWQRHSASLERSLFFRQQLKKQIDQLSKKVSL